MKTKKNYLVLVACCMSFLFVSCESEFGDGGSTGGGKVEPLVRYESKTIQQEVVATDATDAHSADSH